jgi:hypothetical protein
MLWEAPPPTVRMEVPLALHVRDGDQIRFGMDHCLVCGRRAEMAEGHTWGLRRIRRLISRAQRWWHHRKCPPWTITEVQHTWEQGRFATTEITARGYPPRFNWWDRLLGRTRRVEPSIMQMHYEVTRR